MFPLVFFTLMVAWQERHLAEDGVPLIPLGSS